MPPQIPAIILFRERFSIKAPRRLTRTTIACSLGSARRPVKRKRSPGVRVRAHACVTHTPGPARTPVAGATRRAGPVDFRYYSAGLIPLCLEVRLDVAAQYPSNAGMKQMGP